MTIAVDLRRKATKQTNKQMGQNETFCILSHFWATKFQASLHKCPDSPEPALLHTEEIDVYEGSYQNLDLVPRWISQHWLSNHKKVVCFSRLPKYKRSLYGKQCGPRGAVCSWSTLYASILKFASNVLQLFAADDFNRRHFLIHFSWRFKG